MASVSLSQQTTTNLELISLCIQLVWLATLILGRDASLAVAAVYYRYASLPSPKTLTRFWDFSLPSAEVHPTTISKYNTFLQLLLIGATTALPLTVMHGMTSFSLPRLGEVGVGSAMGWAQGIVATTTVWSGATYLWTKDAVKILGGEMGEQRKKVILKRGRGIIGVCFAGVLGIALWIEGFSV